MNNEHDESTITFHAISNNKSNGSFVMLIRWRDGKRHASKYTEIVEGSLVLLKNKNNHRMGRKLEVKYLGTCEVVFLVGKGGTKLKNVASGKELKNLYSTTW